MYRAWKRQTWISVALLAGINLGTLFYLKTLINSQRLAYQTLRSEDGFMLLESLAFQIQNNVTHESGLERSLDIQTKDHLDHLVQYRDIRYLSVETRDDVLYRSTEGMEGDLPSLWDDRNAMAAVFEGEPFSRLVQNQQEAYLEYTWPLNQGDLLWGVLRLGLSLEVTETLEHNFSRSVLILIFFIVLLDVLALISLYLSHKLVWEERKLTAIMDHIQDGVHIFNTRKSLYINPVFKALAGGEWKNLQLEKAYEVRTIGERSILFLRSKLEQATLLIARDVTVENMAEAARLREKRMLSVGQLSSSFAHEIRNPLNTISMLIQTMRYSDQTDSELRNDNLDLVLKEIERLNQAVREFIQIAKLPQINPQWIQIGDLLKELGSFYHQRLQELGVSLQFENKLEFERVWLDGEKVRGVLINLLENALEAETKTITICTSLDHELVHLTVKDDGQGMDAEVLDRAFEIYYTTKATGSGLGLPHAQRIMSAHGGFLKLESNPGAGTQVHLYFPMEKGSKE